jgi:thymidylate synthase
MWTTLVDDDGGINSNYGQYIFKKGTGVDFVVSELQADKDSRRASIVILSSHHLKAGSKDVPCTYSLNFRIRNNALKMSVHMRSQDAIFGMTNDVACFSFIHECVFNLLKDYYPWLSYGDYTHTADSFHVYERHFDMIAAMAKAEFSAYVPVHCPTISGADEVRFLIAGAFTDIPESFKFTQWLLDN